MDPKLDNLESEHNLKSMVTVLILFRLSEGFPAEKPENLNRTSIYRPVDISIESIQSDVKL